MRENAQLDAFTYIFPESTLFIFVYCNVGITQRMSPPGATNDGEHVATVVFAPLMFMNAVGFFIGYCCEFARRSTMLVAFVVRFVFTMTSLHVIGVTVLHDDGTMVDGTTTNR